MHINRCCNSWRQKCNQERSREGFKNKDLILEIQRMWNVKAKLMLVVIWATGTISKALRKYLSNMPGKHKIKEIQK
jgi:hypothetical protein